tara:strand:- start:768 stop:1052 length:285 start_codon:yes stop_codon:yes gene_type:complete
MSIYPFYRVFDDKGEQYCDCGWEKHAQERVLANRGFSYRRIDAPKPINPETVDVSVTPTEELPGQQGLPKAVDRLPFEPELDELPESEFVPFEL